MNSRNKYRKGQGFALGLAIGFPLGMAIGFTMDNIALGPAFGAALGGGLGAAFESSFKKKREEAGEGTDAEPSMPRNTALIVAGLLGVGVLAFLVLYLVLRG